MEQASERPRRKRLSWESRCEIVWRIEQGMSPPLAAASGGASRATGYRLWQPYRQGGWSALRDRRSTPHRQPRRLCAEAEQAILAARRRSAYGTAARCFPGSRAPPAARTATSASVPVSSCTSTRRSSAASGSRASACSVSGLANRRVGWQHLHVAIDDHSRLAYAELLPGQDAHCCVAFLERASAWYRGQGVLVERVLTDNAKAYHSQAWLEAARRLALERRYTRIYRPRTNGKAERLIQTLLREWAYARSYRSSSDRARALGGYLRWYNRRRPHSSLGARPPISRVSHVCGHDS